MQVPDTGLISLFEMVMKSLKSVHADIDIGSDSTNPLDAMQGYAALMDQDEEKRNSSFNLQLEEQHAEKWCQTQCGLPGISAAYRIVVE